MTDLAVLAVGLAGLPIAAILLYGYRETVAAHPAAMWGGLAGVLAFLALSHAMAAVLVNHSLFGDAAIATTVATTGLLVGAGLGWLLLDGSLIRTDSARIVWAAVAFLLLHSVSDGLVLGSGFVGGFTPFVRIDPVIVSATVVHRLAEGGLVVVPALAATWKARSTFAVLLVSLVSIPAAYLPGWIFEAYSSPTRGFVQVAVPTFVAAMEAAIGLFLLAQAFLPKAAAHRGTRWPIWVATGFIVIGIVHFFVE